MSKNKFKTKLKRDMVEGILNAICIIILDDNIETDDDKMFVAVLDEIRLKIETKLINPQRDYQLSFTPSQAFALRIVHTHYLLDRTTYVGNKLMQLANQIHQQYC